MKFIYLLIAFVLIVSCSTDDSEDVETLQPEDEPCTCQFFEPANTSLCLNRITQDVQDNWNSLSAVQMERIIEEDGCN